jgi:thiol-disulfide isomerase/thioredoxin
VALALTGCAGAAPDAESTAPSIKPTATDAADAAATPSSTPPADVTEDAQPAAPAPGAYVDWSDGIIAATSGPKVLFFHASWCPQCRTLDEQLRAEGVPDGLTVIKVDYDSRTDLRQQYGVTLQTTVVYVDDNGELLSSAVLYDDPSIESLLAAAP